MHMSRMIQIRHVPEQLHKRLKARAAMAGMTLSDFLKQELERTADQLTYNELSARLASLPRRSVREAPVTAVRKERDSR